jgi:uridine phosphorylase
VENTEQPHIKVGKDTVNENILLPGDPARVLIIAEEFENPTKIVENREYLGYNGEYKGIKVAAMSTGMGCPSTLIAMEELANIGVKNFVRIGTCGGLLPAMKSGDLIIPTAAIKPDGEMLGADLRDTPVEGDKELLDAMIEAAEELGVTYFTGVNRTHDSFYESIEEFVKLKGKGLVSSEMECAAVYLVGKQKGLKTGCILVINTPEPPEEVEKNPDMIYQLADKEAVKLGVENATKISLMALKKVNSK